MIHVNINNNCKAHVAAHDTFRGTTETGLECEEHSFNKKTRRVPIQRAVERDEIPYPYKIHDTTLRPLVNITIKSTIVVCSRSRSCGGGDICGTTPA